MDEQVQHALEQDNLIDISTGGGKPGNPVASRYGSTILRDICISRGDHQGPAIGMLTYWRIPSLRSTSSRVYEQTYPPGRLPF